MNDNKLIAEFMGHEPIVRGDDVYYELNEIRLTSADDLRYHTSWDWLMPVIEKIGREYKLGNLLGVMRALRKHSTLQGFDEIYEAVVGFIKEHNNG